MFLFVRQQSLTLIDVLVFSYLINADLPQNVSADQFDPFNRTEVGRLKHVLALELLRLSK